MSRLSELFDRRGHIIRTDRLRRQKNRHTLAVSVVAGVCLLAGCSGSSGPAPVTNETANSDVLASAPAVPSLSRSRSSSSDNYQTPISNPEVKVIPSKSLTSGLAFSPDGLQLAAACNDGYFRIWEIEDGSISAEIACPSGAAEIVCYSPDGKFIVGGSRGGGVWLVDPVSQKTEQVVEEKQAVVATIRFSPDFSSLVICWQSGRVAVVNAQGDVEFNINLGASVSGLTLAPDGNELFICPAMGELPIYRISDGQQIDSLNPQLSLLGQAAYLGNGRLVVSGLDGQVTIWDRTGKQRLSMRKLQHAAYRVEAHPDEQHVLLGTSSSDAGGAYLWDLNKQPIPLTGLSAGVQSIALDSSGRLAAAGAMDNTIHIWDIDLPVSVEPPTDTVLANLAVWHDRLSGSGDATASVDWSQYEAEDEKLVEGTLRDLLVSLMTGKLSDAKQEFSDVMISRKEAEQYFAQSGNDVWKQSDEFRKSFSSKIQLGRARKQIVDFTEAEINVRNIRTTRLDLLEGSLLDLLPEDMRVYSATVTASLEGMQSTLPIGSFIVLPDNTIRMLAHFSDLATQLEAEGNLPLKRAAAKPLAPLSEAGKAFLGVNAGQLRDDNGLDLPLRWCPAGNFRMGTDPQNTPVSINVTNEKPVDVTVSAGFWIGENEVTRGQWKTVMGTEPWKLNSQIAHADDLPATYITWKLAQTFCEKLTQQERQAGRLPGGWEYNLPTEAQWEYACRAGTTETWFFGNESGKLDDYGWYRNNSHNESSGNSEIHKFGQKAPNAWGLHDILGNVQEWCRDYYAERLEGGTDPLGPNTNQNGTHVLRGGHLFSDEEFCRCAVRGFRNTIVDPSFGVDHGFGIGFRVAIVRSLQ